MQKAKSTSPSIFYQLSRSASDYDSVILTATSFTNAPKSYLPVFSVSIYTGYKRHRKMPLFWRMLLISIMIIMSK